MNTNKFQEEIGVLFKDDRILKEALTHRSYLNEHKDWPYEHNERLEFLGDAVLELAVTKYLFGAFPKTEEGELTMMRAALVNAKMLTKVAESIHLEEHLLLSNLLSPTGEKEQTKRAIMTVLADAFEALVGAIYLDQGYEAAEKFVKNKIISRVDEIKKQGYRDPKSVLQEKAHGLKKITPTYKVLEESGPESQKIFRTGVYFGKKLVAIGEGPSKQEAEIEAARKALAAFS
ncbi:MAG: ribonuclease III [Parcubacteria group bacterium]